MAVFSGFSVLLPGPRSGLGPFVRPFMRSISGLAGIVGCFLSARSLMWILWPLWRLLLGLRISSLRRCCSRSIRIPLLGTSRSPRAVLRWLICRVAVGDLWLPGGRFLVGDSRTPLSSEDVLHIPPGTLIRLLPAGQSRPPCVSLSHKLRQPKRWFRPTSWGLPEVEQGRGGVGLVGPWGDWSCIHTSPSMSSQSLRQAIATCCGVPQSDLWAVATCHHVPDLFFRGRKVASVLSVMPRALAGACVVFVDARDLGLPVRSLCLPPIFTTVGALLRLAGGSRPLGLTLLVEGAASFDRETETFMSVHKAVVCVRVPPPEFVGRTFWQFLRQPLLGRPFPLERALAPCFLAPPGGGGSLRPYHAFS